LAKGVVTLRAVDLPTSKEEKDVPRTNFIGCGIWWFFGTAARLYKKIRESRVGSLRAADLCIMLDFYLGGRQGVRQFVQVHGEDLGKPYKDVDRDLILTFPDLIRLVR
jgi:hypothetical protein